MEIYLIIFTVTQSIFSNQKYKCQNQIKSIIYTSIMTHDKAQSKDNPAQQKFEFTNRMSHNKYLNCLSCKQLMLRPIRLHKCGHTFCNNCVQPKNVKKCIICLEKIHIKQQDILATRLVGELQVQCLNNGCPWKGTLSNYQSIHSGGCKLKNGGIQQWIKGLQQMIGNQKATSNPTLSQQNEQLQLNKEQLQAGKQLQSEYKQGKVQSSLKIVDKNEVQNITNNFTVGLNQPLLQKQFAVASKQQIDFNK